VQQSFDEYPTYSSTVLAQNPSAYWPLSDTGADTATDLSGNGNTGTLEEDVTEGANGPPVSTAAGMAFDRSGGISTPLTQPSVTEATYGAWINTTASEEPIISGRDNGNTVDGNLTLDVGMFNSGSGYAEFGLDTSYTAFMKQSTIPVDTGDWEFVVGTFSSISGAPISTSDMKIYVDGALDTGSDVYSGGGSNSPISASSDIYIGERPCDPTFFNGDIADAFVTFGTALTDNQIEALYRGQLTQAINFTASGPTTADVGDTYTPAATSTSSLPVTLSVDSSTSSVCSMSAGVVTLNALGDCEVDATQAGDATYTSAPEAEQAFVIPDDYQGALLALGPSEFWPLSETDGTRVLDVSGNNDRGEFQGSVEENALSDAGGEPQAPTTPVVGISGSGEVSTSTFMTMPTTVSEAVWFNASAADGGLLSFQSVQTGDPDGGWDEQMYVGSDGELNFGICGGSDCVSDISTSTSVDNGEWYLAVGVISPYAFSLYLNGALVGTNTTSGAPQAQTGWWRLGEVYGNSWPDINGGDNEVTGELADPAIFPSALTAAQVTALYAGEKTQSVTFTSSVPTNPEFGDTYTPIATASSGLAVTFTIDASSSSVCSISGGVVTINASGGCVIDAN
jgi:hypothetical protein